MSEKISSAAIKNLVHITTPLNNTENSVGEDTCLTSYDQIKSLRPYKDVKNINNTWSNVINLCISTLQKTKDLNICCWLLEAMSYENNLEGFADGMEIISDLLITFPNCYPLGEEEKITALHWVNDHMSTWFDKEEILPDLYLKNIHQDIFTSKINKDLFKKMTYNENYLNTKITLINTIKNIITKMELYNSCLKSVIFFLQRIENFYLIYKQILSPTTPITPPREDPTEENNTPFPTSKDQIFHHLSQLIHEGLMVDKSDLLLYLMQKILLLRNKPYREIFKILRENNLANLIDS